MAETALCLGGGRSMSLTEDLMEEMEGPVARWSFAAMAS